MRPAFFMAMMAGRWSPRDLGSKLRAWWAPLAGSNYTLNGSAVASWTDEVGGYALAQATAANQPAYSATGFSGGLACAVFDGSNDSLVLDVIPSGILTGNAASEVWAHARCDTPVGDTSSDNLLDYGGSGTGSDRRTLARISGDKAIIGYNGLNANGTVSTVAAFGTHVWRGVYQTTYGRLDMDGVTGPQVSTTANSTGTARIRLGGRSDSTTGAPWTGAVRQVLITDALTSAEAASLLSYLNGSL